MSTPAGRGPISEALGLVAFVVVCLGVGALGAAATASSLESWYQDLVKPAWTPPGAVFGPVWTVLYVLMGIAAWWVWRSRSPVGARRIAMAAFAVQLALNALWSQLFFGWRSPGLALAEIVILWAAIATTARLFGRIERAAGWLLAPYLAWVTFALALNASIWSLN